MKKISILTALLCSAYATSQGLEITPKQIDNAYNRELQYQSDLQAQAGVIESQAKIISDLKVDVEKTTNYVTSLVDANEELTKQNFSLIESTAKAEQKIKDNKRFGISVFAGYGAYSDEKVNFAPMVGVGVSYDLIRF